MSLRTALVPLVSMTVFQVMITMSVLTVPVFAVRLARDLGLPSGLVGFYMSVVFAAAMIGAVTGGRIVLRFGAIRVAQACLVLAALGLLTLRLGGLAAALAASVLLGCAYGPPAPAGSHILARTTPSRLMPIVFSLKQTGVPAGGMLAGALVPPMVLAWGWRGAAAAVAVVCLIVAAALQPLHGRLDTDRRRVALTGRSLFAPLRLVMRDPGLRRMSLVSFAYSSVQMSLVAYLVTYLVEVVGLDLVGAGAVLAASQLSGVVCRVGWGAISGRLLSPRALLIGLGLVMAVAAALTALFTPAWPLAALYGVGILFGATAIGWNGVYLAELARMAPAGQAGVATGGSVFVTFAGVVFAPAVFGALVATGVGFRGGFAMLAVLGLLGPLLLWRAGGAVRG